MTFYIHTSGGGKFLYGSRLAEVTVEDIAHHLSGVARYCGATRHHYSVAQHDVLVVELLRREKAPRRTQLLGLHHDDHEYVMSDIPTPFSKWFAESFCDGVDLLGLAKDTLDAFIFPKIGIPYPWTDAEYQQVHRMDSLAFLVESRQLFEGGVPEWWEEAVHHYGFTLDEIPLDIVIPRMLPEQAKAGFLELHTELFNGNDECPGAARHCA
jgi:hypothetical protein